MLIVRVLIFALLAAILVSLFSALGLIMKNKGRGRDTRIVKALTLRIGLSLSLFVLLMLAFYFGLLPSNGHP
ncbi:MAG TPA: twin transmembrane helix small protein [Acidiferrobacteraceae bacterium]|nr:twin transmembrane helix small protein [Acidiferrobacteraceae bacterium]